jgi:sugar phosphate isomerase/epimerase
LKLAAQENMVPGSNLPEKLQRMESYGFEGLEIWGKGLPDRIDEIGQALASSSIKASTICAGYGGCLLDPNKAEREKAMADIKALLEAGAKLGVVGLITVPIFGGPRLPDLSPLAGAMELEKKLLTLQVKELGKHAQEVGCYVLMEPLNRYETHLLRTLKDGLEIQEKDIPASLREAGGAVQHVHLADSTRLLPGYGHTDFKAGFSALKEIGFDKYMALECGIPGKPEEELPKAVSYLRSCM